MHLTLPLLYRVSNAYIFLEEAYLGELYLNCGRNFFHNFNFNWTTEAYLCDVRVTYAQNSIVDELYETVREGENLRQLEHLLNF